MIQVNSDGGSRGNPGLAAIGYVIRQEDKILEEHKEVIGEATNNVAEYMAIIKALKAAAKLSNEVECFLDSELVVKQLRGEYSVSNITLKALYNKVKEIEKDFKKISYTHVSRENKYQKIADKLVNKALDGYVKR